MKDIDLSPSTSYKRDKFFRAMARIMASRSFETQDEAQAYLREHVIGKPLDEVFALAGIDDDPLEQAAELTFRAQEVEDPAEAATLCRRALEIDPGNIDAALQLIFLDATPENREETVHRIRELLAAAGERLAPQIEEWRGEMWGRHELRPYLRARYELVAELLRAERLDEAMAEALALLELDRDDHQGIRHHVLFHRLSTADVNGLRDILGRFPDEDDTFFAWSRVLLALIDADSESGVRLLVRASESNRHLISIFAGRRRPNLEAEHRAPEPGSVEEAEVFLQAATPLLAERQAVLEVISRISAHIEARSPVRRKSDRKALKKARKKGRR